MKAQTEEIDLTKMHPKEMWMLTNFLKNGLQSHHNTANIIKFKDESGNLAKTEKTMQESQMSTSPKFSREIVMLIGHM